MAFVSLEQIALQSRKHANRTARVHTARLSVAAPPLRRAEPDGQRQLVFQLSEQLAKEARLFPRDRVDVLFDREARLGLIVRKTDGSGYAVSAHAVRKDEIKDNVYYPCQIKMTHYDGMPLFPAERTECEKVVVKNEGIMFVLPIATQF